MIYKFTNKAKKVIEIANDVSVELGHNYIGTEHILYGLVKEGEGLASKILTSQGLKPEYVEEEINEAIAATVKALPDIMYVFIGIVLIFFVITVMMPLIDVYMGGFLMEGM